MNDVVSFDFEALSYAECYRLLVNTVVPRPIAFVTSMDASGTLNAAPFSFFNVMGHDPPVVVLGIERHGDRGLKDTAANILATKEFVVNLVSESMAEAMSACSQDVSSHVDELSLVDLSTAESTKLRVPRIAEAPASLECRQRMSITIGEGRTLVVGDVVAMHLQARFYDEATRHVLTPEMGLIARMHGSGWYARTTDLFYTARPGREDDGPA